MLIVALATACIVICQSDLQAQLIFVDQSASGEHTGLNWDDAFTDLQTALSAAAPGDEIWVAAGKYYPTQDPKDRNARFVLPNGVRLFGGFGGFETIRTERNWNLFSTTLSGDINRNGSLSGNSHTVLDISGAESGSRVDGFTITGGNAEVLASEGYPRNNSGGGIYNSGGEAVIANCVISGNSANQGAGMANLNDASVRIENSIFRSNVVVIPGGGGGLLNAENSRAKLVSCLFDSNESLTTGGAVLNIYQSDLIIEHSRFINNSALNGAAVFVFDSSKVDISSSVFQGNSAAGSGGVVASVLFNKINIHNSLITGNIAEKGGAFYAEKGDFRLINCTVTGNRAGLDGAIIYKNASGLFELYNSIFWENRTDEVDHPPYSPVYHNGSSGSILYKHSIVQGSGSPENWNSELGKDGGGNREYDPLFLTGVAASEAPSTKGNFRLTECSPAVNFGKNELLQGQLSVDIDGNPRIIDGIVDKGAYEFADEVPPPDIECLDAVVNLELSPPIIRAVNDFYEVLDSCGPVMGSVYELDSLQFDCSHVGINSFTIIARDLYSEKSDSCEVQIEVVNPTYSFTLNDRLIEPGGEFTFCPGTPLKLGVHSSVYPAAPLVIAFRLGQNTESNIGLSDKQSFAFSLEEIGVYPLTFLSIEDANACSLDEDEASQYFFSIRIAEENDTTMMVREICRGDLFEGIPIDNDTTIVNRFVSSKGCDSLVISAVEVFESPELYLKGDSVFCHGTQAVIYASRGFEDYEWGHTASDQREIKVDAGGIFTLSATDAFGCTFSENYAVRELKPIVPEIESVSATCSSSNDGSVRVLSAMGGLGDFRIEINGKALGGIPASIESDPGAYYIEIQDRAGCLYSEVVEVDFEIEPTVEILGPSRIEAGDSLFLQAGFNLPDPLTVEWKVNGEIVSGGSFFMSLLPNTDVFVELKMVDASNCEDFDYRNIEVFEPASVFIPNAFSPNRDGINDSFTVFTDGDHSIELLRIIDRWGNVVFEARDIPANSPEFGWDGQFRGSASETGEYLYQIQLRDAEQLRKFSGSVVLIR